MNSRKPVRFTLGLLFVAFAASNAWAVELHVSTAGKNESGTGSVESPWATIGRALEAAQPGDAIVLHNGVYCESVRILSPNITIMSAAGEWAVIKAPIGTGDAPGLCIKFDVDASHGALKRLELIGGYYAVKIESRWDWGGVDQSGATDILIEDCVIHDSGRDCIKITPNCDRVTIRRCEIFNSGRLYPPGTPFEQKNAEGIDCTNADETLVQDCYVHDTATTGVYFKGGATDCVVERSRIVRCGHGGVLLGFDTSPEFFDLTANPRYYECIRGVVRNCIIQDTDYEGIGVFAANGATAVNNTVINTARVGHNPIYFGLTLQDYDPAAGRPPSVDVEVRNNLVFQPNANSAAFVFIRYLFEPELGGLLAVDGMPTMSHNLYFGSAGAPRFTDSRPGSILDNGSFSAWKTHINGEFGTMVADPMLDKDARLTRESPANDAGIVLMSVDADIDAEERPAGGSPDIGADEFSAKPPAFRTYGDGMTDGSPDPACGVVNLPKDGDQSPDADSDPLPDGPDEVEVPKVDDSDSFDDTDDGTPVVNERSRIAERCSPFAAPMWIGMGLLSIRRSCRRSSRNARRLSR
ncbi:MAG: right-handed parallel beta-helix repeat-containing protein [Planctomycetes bacterium]|nr:right-handed parallel beta-helix repeat-containing protein [Planctomycetota bacterium]